MSGMSHYDTDGDKKVSRDELVGEGDRTNLLHEAMFDVLDVDKSGQLTLEGSNPELTGSTYNAAMFDVYFQHDTDGNGLSASEIAEISTKYGKNAGTELITAADYNGDGLVTRGELICRTAGLSARNKVITGDQIRAANFLQKDVDIAMQQLDADKNGEITYDEAKNAKTIQPGSDKPEPDNPTSDKSESDKSTTNKTDEKASDSSSSTGKNVTIIVIAVLGALLVIGLIALIIYKMKRKTNNASANKSLNDQPTSMKNIDY